MGNDQFTTPLITKLNIEVCGELNNLSIASAIYDWYRNKIRPFDHERINISIIADLIKIQAGYDELSSMTTSIGEERE